MFNLSTSPPKIDDILTTDDFEKTALSLFYYQATHNIVYKKYINLLGLDINTITTIDEIPFMPIDFFKTHKIIVDDATPQVIFKSSGTTQNNRSNHYVKDISVYEKSFLKGFEHFYGNITDYHFLALLPNYLEQGDSSLVYMIQTLINKSGKPTSGFYLDDYQKLSHTLLKLNKKKEKVFLIGVSYALLDLIDFQTFQLDANTIILETGGMKGRRKELIKSELHQELKKGFGVNQIHSEYGMTELLSQAYALKNGIFNTPPWMKIKIRDTNDPFSYLPNGKTGGINVIDLANIYSCSFIATQDLGKLYDNNSFEILGRFDNSDIRGCNLLVE